MAYAASRRAGVVLVVKRLYMVWFDIYYIQGEHFFTWAQRDDEDVTGLLIDNTIDPNAINIEAFVSSITIKSKETSNETTLFNAHDSLKFSTFAHATLKTSTPKDNAMLMSSPPELSLVLPSL